MSFTDTSYSKVPARAALQVAPLSLVDILGILVMLLVPYTAPQREQGRNRSLVAKDVSTFWSLPGVEKFSVFEGSTVGQNKYNVCTTSQLL